MKAYSLTYIGKRKINQDAILIGNIDPETFLYLVSDGMGGYNNGEIAAQITIDSLFTFLTNTKLIDENSIQKAVNKANLAIRQFQEQDGSKLGATLGGIIISNGIAKCFWVGDVKIFHFSDNKLTFESKSHNLINELGDSNTLNSAKFSHIVTRSIQGDVAKSFISYQELKINKNDKLLICSDGVHGIIGGDSMLYQLNNSDNSNFIDKIEKRIVNEAKDNASLIFISED